LKRNLHAGKKPKIGLGFQVFTEDELNDIHLATLEVLEHTGLFFDDEEALEVLDGGGAVIDKKNRVAKFPSHVVEDAIRSAPSTILLAGRNPRHDFVMENNRVGFTNFGEGVFINDLYTGKLRETTKADVAASALIADYLSEIDVYERAVGAGDMPPQTVQLHNAEAWLPNTSKHGFMGSGNGYLTKKLVDMAAAITGGRDKLQERPIISFITCPVSPLQFIKDSCEIIMETARAGLAINVLSVAGHPGRHTGGSQRRSPRRTCPEPMHPQRDEIYIRQFHHGNGFEVGHRISRISGVCADQCRGGPDVDLLSAAKLGSRRVGRQ
jgi:trimethylamine--corrinoid protein Co-methyltransferase